ncbi:3-keto-disaccharide hydrolase [Agaribacter flavus]|uniref:DUF1080 domain-containing protein n=1 Tax=Agaribacter flavus TaxID=1902781 RepID=A0ABV7FRH6_9ALTE
MRTTKKSLAISIVLALLSVSACMKIQQDHPSFRPLFNGKDLSDWVVKTHRYALGEDPDGTFTVHDGTIRVDYKNYEGKFNQRFSHLYYKQAFQYFHLKLEYRFRGQLYDGAPHFANLNSGVMFYAQAPESILQDQNWPLSVEMQFLASDDPNTPISTGNVCTPGTHIRIKDQLTTTHCIRSNSDTYYRDEWVMAELIVQQDSVKHIINGKTVLEYAYPEIGFTGTIKGIEEDRWSEGQVLEKGYIALQSEGQAIDFRSIQIKEL